jgi:hypothetical protein
MSHPTQQARLQNFIDKAFIFRGMALTGERCCAAFATTRLMRGKAQL